MNGHQFCVDCVKQYMETWLGDSKSNFPCLHQEPCAETFSPKEIERCLGTRDFKRYENLVRKQSIKAALDNGELKGYEECPHVCDTSTYL
jgi:TRIAD3 protein (E3 ubiquitin-protein ligase RNF216)